MGTALFLLLGLVIWVGLAVGLGLLGDATGIPPAIYHDPPIGYEIDGEYLETSSTPTSFGQALMIFTLVLAIWITFAIVTRKWHAGFTPRGRMTLLSWLLATGTLVAVGALIDLALRQFSPSAAYYLRLLLEPASAFGVGWSCYQWWRNRVARLPKDGA